MDPMTVLSKVLSHSLWLIADRDVDGLLSWPDFMEQPLLGGSRSTTPELCVDNGPLSGEAFEEAQSVASLQGTATVRAPEQLHQVS